MEYELTLEEDKRKFLSLDGTFSLKRYFLVPIAFYFLWAIVYYLIHFVIAQKRIRDRNYGNLF
jgi:hypothetical protein